MSKDIIGVVGGDLRQVYLCDSLIDDGYKVYSYGLEKSPIESKEIKIDFEEIARKCNILIFGVPMTRDGKNFYAPLSAKSIELDDCFKNLVKSKKLFGGIVKPYTFLNDLNINNYYANEIFTLENAILTSQGAIASLLVDYPKSIKESSCLVAGYGRIGKVLAKDLSGLGAKVYVSARKQRDLEDIKSNGYVPVETSQIKSVEEIDIIFSTIPAMIFDKDLLLKAKRDDTLIIDLSSGKGSVDYVEAKKIGVNVHHELSLPSRFTPKSAGDVVKKSVYFIMEGG